MSTSFAWTHRPVLRALCVLVLASLIAVGIPVVPPRAHAVPLPTTWWVDAVGGSDSNTGTDTVAPFKTITRALSVASAFDVVKIKPGLYNTANGETFPLSSYSVSLQSTDGTTTTIIDADYTNWAVYLWGPLLGTEVTGLTIRNGKNGGFSGILVQGNGVNTTDTPRIANNYIQGNESTVAAGAVYIYDNGPGTMKPRIEGNVFTDNSGITGGAISVGSHVSATIRNNTFIGNHASDGGAIFDNTQYGEQADIRDNIFKWNTAFRGGAIRYTGTATSTLTLSDNTFDSNVAYSYGGSLYFRDATVVMSGNDVSGSETTATYGTGGFAWSDESTITAFNNSIAGPGVLNTGAAWYVSGGQFRETNDTVFNSQEGLSAIYATGGADAQVTNCILWNPALASDVENVGSLSYSCVHDSAVATKGNTVGSGVFFSDPLFANPGAHTIDLAANSPCIDAGSNGSAPAVDFYGTIRPIDGDLDGVALADIGAFERKLDSLLTFSAPSVCNYGSAKVTGTLKNKLGAGVAGLPVLIEYSYDNWSTVAGSKTVTTNGSGAFSWTFAPTKKTYYRAQFKGDATRYGSNRVWRTVLPKVSLTKPSAASTMRYGRSYKVTGYLKPRHTAGTTPVVLRLWRYRSGKWRLQTKHYHAKVSSYSSYSKYSMSIKLPSRGKWRLKAYHAKDSLNAETLTTYRSVTVR
jgi:hypothetical protein